MTRVVDWMTSDLRLPMTPPSQESRMAVDKALDIAGLMPN
jgi:hypothetical protein